MSTNSLAQPADAQQQSEGHLVKIVRDIRQSLEAVLDGEDMPPPSSSLLIELHGRHMVAERRLRPLLYPLHPMLAAAMQSESSEHPS